MAKVDRNQLPLTRCDPGGYAEIVSESGVPISAQAIYYRCENNRMPGVEVIQRRSGKLDFIIPIELAYAERERKRRLELA